MQYNEHLQNDQTIDQREINKDFPTIFLQNARKFAALYRNKSKISLSRTCVCVSVCMCVCVQKWVPPALGLSAAYPITASRIHEGSERVFCHFLGRLMFQAEARQKPLDRFVSLESRVSSLSARTLSATWVGRTARSYRCRSSSPLHFPSLLLSISISLWFRLAIRREKRFAKWKIRSAGKLLQSWENRAGAAAEPGSSSRPRCLHILNALHYISPRS